MEKIYKITYWVFLCESVLIIIGVFLGECGYENGWRYDIGVAFEIAIIQSVLLLLFLFCVLVKFNETVKKVLYWSLSWVILGLIFYYLVDLRVRFI